MIETSVLLFFLLIDDEWSKRQFKYIKVWTTLIVKTNIYTKIAEKLVSFSKTGVIQSLF